MLKLASVLLFAAAAHAYAPRAAPRGPARLAATTTATPEVDAANPFAIVGEDLKNMKQRIKALVERSLDGGGGSSSKSGGSHPLLQEAAREFFERRERAFRPAVVLLVARAVEGTASGTTLPEKQCLLAEIVEMMCTAQVVHDSVLEDDEAGSTGNVAHRTYSQNAGNKVSVLAGDFLLARCSVALSELGDLAVVELMATALESMVQGGVLKAQAGLGGLDGLLDWDAYVARVELKTSSLIADACRSAAILGGEAADGAVAEAVYAYASNLGVAYQINADTIAYVGALEEGGNLADHVAAPPVLLAAAKDDGLRADLGAALDDGAGVAAVAAHVDATGGLDRARRMARDYSDAAKAALGPLPASDEKAALLMMADFVAQDDQTGLQREKYIAAAAKKRRAAVSAHA